MYEAAFMNFEELKQILQTDPSQWTEDQVCKWLELVGLGSFRENFRRKRQYMYIIIMIVQLLFHRIIYAEGKVDGKKLLQMDIRMFGECTTL